MDLSASFPGGASPEELRDLLEPPTDEETAGLAARFARMNREEVAAYNAATARLREERQAQPRYPHLRLYPVHNGDAFVRFVALVLVDPDESPVRPLIVSGYIGQRGDELAILQLTVESAPFGEPTTLNSSSLRAAARGAGAILAKARAELAEEPAWLEVMERFGIAAVTPEERERARALAEAAEDLPLRRGRSGYPDEHYRQVALKYLDLQRQGIGRGILVRLAEIESQRLGRTVPRATVRDWVHGATKRGFLTTGRQGRAGRDPGPNLIPRKEP